MREVRWADALGEWQSKIRATCTVRDDCQSRTSGGCGVEDVRLKCDMTSFSNNPSMPISSDCSWGSMSALFVNTEVMRVRSILDTVPRIRHKANHVSVRCACAQGSGWVKLIFLFVAIKAR